MSQDGVGLVVNIEWCLIHVCSRITGYSVKAIRRKIDGGKWQQGKHFQKAPDGRLHIHMPTVYKWIQE